MDKRSSRMQRQFPFRGQAKQTENMDGLYLGSEGSVPERGPTLGKCDLARGSVRKILGHDRLRS